MINIKHFIIKFLLFALSHAIIFGMQQPCSYPLSAAFNPTNDQITLIYPDQSMKIWNLIENSIKTVSHDSIETKINIKEYDQKQLSHNSITIFKSIKILIGYKNNITFTSEAFTKNILSCALNAHNEEQPIIAIGFEHETYLYNKINTNKLFNDLQKENASYTLQHEEGIYSTALAFNSDGTKLVSCTNDGKGTLYSFENNQLIPLNTAIIINQPIEHPTKQIIEPQTEGRIIKPKQTNLIVTIIGSPLYALKALYHNTKFVTKTITALAGIGLLWLYYTKYLVAKA